MKPVKPPPAAAAPAAAAHADADSDESAGTSSGSDDEAPRGSPPRTRGQRRGREGEGDGQPTPNAKPRQVPRRADAARPSLAEQEPDAEKPLHMVSSAVRAALHGLFTRPGVNGECQQAEVYPLVASYFSVDETSSEERSAELLGKVETELESLDKRNFILIQEGTVYCVAPLTNW